MYETLIKKIKVVMITIMCVPVLRLGSVNGEVKEVNRYSIFSAHSGKTEYSQSK